MARGDHILVKRWGGLYHHHGIDMGDGTVIHFSGEPLRWNDARVQRCDMDTFLKGGKKIIVRYDDDIETLPVADTIRLAEDQLEQTGYSLFRSNCEHFATNCKMGRQASEQVNFYIRVGATMVLIGMAAVGAAVGARVLEKTGGRTHLSKLMK